MQKPNERDVNKLLTTADVARCFGVSVSTVRAWVRDGRVPCLRPSRRVVRFRLADVESAITRGVVHA